MENTYVVEECGFLGTPYTPLRSIVRLPDVRRCAEALQICDRTERQIDTKFIFVLTGLSIVND